MKKIAIISLLLLVCPLIRAIEYTVDKVPNVHLDDGRRFVSNPDGILSAETVNTLDQMLFSLQEANTSEVAVVALQSIGDNDIDDFATDLFTRWGIGKQNDNGLLVLLVLDQRRITFRTGYGIEGILPDAICKRIQTQYVIPQFKQGDYDKGILDGMNVITRILTTPEAVKELTAAPVKKGIDWERIIGIYLTVSLVVSHILLFAMLWNIAHYAKKDAYERYKRLAGFRPYLLAGSFLFPFFVLLLYGGLGRRLKRLRNKPRNCESCGNKMRKLDEEEDNRYLTPQENTEERLNSVDYDVWLCDHCGNTLVYPYENQFTQYQKCPYCHSRAYSFEGDHILRRATTVSTGLGEKRYYCSHCHKTDCKQYIIPIIVAAAVVGSGRRGGGFVGGFGGGFGGGATGGGGSTSGW